MINGLITNLELIQQDERVAVGMENTLLFTLF